MPAGPTHLTLVTGKGDSMIPTASTEKVVLVNTGTHSFESDGIYLVNLGHDQQIKHLQYQYGGRLFVISNNRAIQPFEFTE
ncbi:S24 family peptidase [Xylella fastidiosa subsp. sandyi]|uniref:S24 family peptidase n=2 Tax=Xylella fastidiosa TaxID=2371 RepID=UPI003CCF3B5F